MQYTGLLQTIARHNSEITQLLIPRISVKSLVVQIIAFETQRQRFPPSVRHFVFKLRIKSPS